MAGLPRHRAGSEKGTPAAQGYVFAFSPTSHAAGRRPFEAPLSRSANRENQTILSLPTCRQVELYPIG